MASRVRDLNRDLASSAPDCPQQPGELEVHAFRTMWGGWDADLASFVCKLVSAS